MDVRKLLMRNSKVTFSIFFAVLFILYILAGLPVISMAMEGSAGKHVFKKEIKEQKNPYANAKIITRITSSANKTFGYDIFLNGQVLVHQPSIPSLPGNDGFTTKEKAQKIADFVVKKIRKNEMPPTVTTNDLKKMGVLK
jgi:hypothetical protein